jgi:hypothetical protein
MQDFHSELQDSLRTALNAAQLLTPGPEAGYWSFRLNPAPPAIRSPDDFSGGDRLCIASTQTNLPARAQKQLVERWCHFLPILEGVRYIWFTSKVSQDLFEAACKVRDLEGLYVKWSSISSVTSLSAARALKYLHIGSSPAISDLTPIAKLVHLIWLELNNLKTISDLTPLQALSNLEGLAFTGAEGRHHTVLSFAPLAKLSHLRWLHLGSIHAKDNSLRALGTLKDLRWLGVGNFFPWQEFAWLSAQLPNTACPWFTPGDDLGRIGIKCKRCGSGIMLLSGKGSGKLCPTCNAEKFSVFSAKFLTLVAGARAVGA